MGGFFLSQIARITRIFFSVHLRTLRETIQGIVGFIDF